MSRKTTTLIVALLFAATLGPIFYKIYVLDLEFLPTQRDDAWSIEFRAEVDATDKKTEILFPVPASDNRTSILSSRYNGPGYSLSILRQKTGTMGKWVGSATVPTRLSYNINLVINEKYQHVPPLISELKNPPVVPANPYVFDADSEKALRELSSDIIVPSHSKLKKVKAIYHYVADEIGDLRKPVGFPGVLLENKGNSYEKALVVAALCRMHDIPARVVGGLFLFTFTQNQSRNRKVIYWNEVFVDNKWLPLSAPKSQFGQLDKKFLALYRADQDLASYIKNENTRLKIYAERAVSQRFDILKYRAELVEKKSWLLNLSLYHLPLSWQFSFRILLLIPIGTVLLAFARNIIGLKTFGIFMPILLALFFKESTFFFGLAFFAFIVILGFVERRLLNRLYLLAVPKFSIILTLIIIFLTFASLVFSELQLFSSFSPTLFPIIITTVFIEKFSIMIEEEGIINTMKILVGTLVLAMAIFLLLIVPSLQLLVYTYPEILFSVIALQILIGKYNGYRLTELFRFKDFGRVEKTA